VTPPTPIEALRNCRCGGDGFYFVLPAGFNPFEANITTIARLMQKVICGCDTALADLQGKK
jgi:hypothetical protein